MNKLFNILIGVCIISVIFILVILIYMFCDFVNGDGVSDVLYNSFFVLLGASSVSGMLLVVLQVKILP